MDKTVNIRLLIGVFWLIQFAVIPQSVMATGGNMQHDDRLTGPQYSHSLAFSPDGKEVAVGCESRVVRLLDISSGKTVRIFKGHSGAVMAVAFSPDGRYILSGSVDHTLKLWEVSTGKMVRTFTGHDGVVVSVSFARDGRHALSGGEDRRMILWDVSSGQPVRTFTGHDGYAGSAVAFSFDETLVLKGNTLWEKESGKEVRVFKETGVDGYWKDSVQFDADNKTVWIGETLLETASGKAVLVLSGSHGTTLANIVAYSPDGRFVVGGGGQSGRADLWMTGGEPSLPPSGAAVQLRPYSGMDSGELAVIALAISPDSKYILMRTLPAGGDGADILTLWHRDNPDEPIRSFKVR